MDEHNVGGDLFSSRRTVRLYKDKDIERDILLSCVDAARLAPTTVNSQPLEFIIVDDQQFVSQLLDFVVYGGELSESGKPRTDFQAKAFIILVDTVCDDYSNVNAGIAAGIVSLKAWLYGVGSCIMGNIQTSEIKKLLSVPSGYDVPLAVSLGWPAEDPKLVETNDSTAYYRKDGVLHVPKRRLDEVLHVNSYGGRLQGDF